MGPIMEFVKHQWKVRHAQPIEAATHPNALLRNTVVQALTGQSRSTIYAKVAAGTFPAPVKLGARCTRWRAADVTAWLEKVAEAA